MQYTGYDFILLLFCAVITPVRSLFSIKNGVTFISSADTSAVGCKYFHSPIHQAALHARLLLPVGELTHSNQKYIFHSIRYYFSRMTFPIKHVVFISFPLPVLIN